MEDRRTFTHRPGWRERLRRRLFHRPPKDRQELIALLRGAQAHHLLEADAVKMIEGVLQVSEHRARDIMVPRAQMVVIPVAAPLKVFLPTVIESAHSRFPVIGESRDEVIGLLLAKDLLRYASAEGEVGEGGGAFDLRALLRPAVFIPESKRLDVLLREFRLNRNHMAIVVDEYGGIAGLVTIEDVLEEIVGEIEDEYDIGEAAMIKRLGEHHYAVNALTPIAEFNRFFKTQFSDETFDTIGGIVMQYAGHLPKREESFSIGTLSFKVINADSRRVRLFSVKTDEAA